MPTWKAYFIVNGPDFSRFPVVSFPVEDALYAQIQKTICEGTSLRSFPFFEDLVCLAVSSLDLFSLAPDWMETDEIADFVDDLQIESCAIDDPGDMTRFEDLVRGLRLPSDTFVCEDEYCTRRYVVSFTRDDAGCITKVADVQAEGLESESVSSSVWSSCYPDYKLITDALMKKYPRQNEGASHA